MYKHFSDFLKENQKKQGVGNEQLASATGLKLRMIVRFRTGENLPTRQAVRKMCKELNCDIIMMEYLIFKDLEEEENGM